MKKLVVRKIGVATFGRFIGIAHAIIGVVLGVFLGISGTIGVVQEDGWSFFAKVLAIVGVWLGALVLYPIVLYVFGWIYGAVVALVANIFLQAAHGIEVDVDEVK